MANPAGTHKTPETAPKIKPRATSVVLSSPAQQIKDELAPIYGLNKIVSAGLVMVAEAQEHDHNALVRALKLANGIT